MEKVHPPGGMPTMHHHPARAFTIVRQGARTTRSIVVSSALASGLTAAALDLGGGSLAQVLTGSTVSLLASVALHVMAADRSSS